MGDDAILCYQPCDVVTFTNTHTVIFVFEKLFWKINVFLFYCGLNFIRIQSGEICLNNDKTWCTFGLNISLVYKTQFNTFFPVKKIILVLVKYVFVFFKVFWVALWSVNFFYLKHFKDKKQNNNIVQGLKGFVYRDEDEKKNTELHKQKMYLNH